MGTNIELKNLSKTFIHNNKPLEVLKDINLTLMENQFVSLIGPSGCGKSTILRILVGLEKDYTGDILVSGRELSKTSAQFAYMPQKDLLMPWRTVYKNITLALEISGKLDKVQDLNLAKLIKEFGLEGFENFYPSEISGGMRQRANLLRTFLMNSNIMLLDEPFGALDAITRMEMQEWLLGVLDEHKKTVLFITHDIDEAVFLSDKVYVLSKRPASVTATVDIDFKRPRTQEILTTQEFLNYKNIILKALK
jgi:putative hydroxymethylpyrimidine transport system ATP-binding protein